MAKRFTDTDKWDDEWFMDLDPSMKCLWLYICDKCDCAGVWKVNFKKANYVIGSLFDKPSALKAFDGRVIEIGKEKWFIEKFIKFQYPKGLSDSSSIHKGVLKSLNYNNIQTKPYLSLIVGAQRVMDKDKDMDKDSSSFLNSPSYTNSALRIDAIIQLFNDSLASPGIGKIDFCHGLSSGQLQDFITTTSFKEFQTIETWREIFKKVSESEFLKGLNGSFVATLNWIVKHDNALKVLNGQYSGTPDEQKGRKSAFKSKSNGITPTPENPTGSPYLQEALDKGITA